ncbi:MAG: hypothetical protein H7Z43_05315 [Clostridia bacterium]|nr:hypothetical protein [Deltaproteobacteria bacterium]
MKSSVLYLGLTALTFALVACSGSAVESACRDKCSDRCDPRESPGSCEAACEDRANAAEAVSCESQAETLVKCINGSSQRCAESGPTDHCDGSSTTDPAGDCCAQQTAYTACFTDYCTANASDAICPPADAG